MDLQNVKTTIKILVPNDSNNKSYNEIIDYVVDKVVQDMANYTHIDKNDLPEELSHTAIGMSVTLINSDELLTPLADKSADGISSIEEGNEKVTFKSRADEYIKVQNANPITKDYKKILNQFRRIDFG